MNNQTPSWDAFVKRGSQVELATYLIELWGGKENAVWDGGFYTYNSEEHLWEERSHEACKHDIQTFDGRDFGDPRTHSDGSTTRKRITVNDGMCNSVLSLARAQITRRIFVKDPHFFDDAPFGVLCNGVFLHAKHAQVCAEPCKSMHRQRVKLNIDYAQDAHAPLWTKALEGWFGSDKDGMEKRALLAQFVGGALFGLATRYQKALFIVGGGGNGKSQLLDVVESLFPNDFKAAIEPQKWSDSYSRDQLRGVRLNRVNEIPAKTITGGSDFKAIITGDPISAREIYHSPYSYRPRAAHIFTANELPGSTDITNGFWRRVMILPMTKRFDGTSEDIPELGQKIIASEMQGVLAWAVEGARRLLEQDRYTIPVSSLDAVQDWRDSCDPLGQWLNERTTAAKNKHERTRTNALFQDWQTWSQGEFQPKSARGFSLKLKKRFGRPHRSNGGSLFPLMLKA